MAQKTLLEDRMATSLSDIPPALSGAPVSTDYMARLTELAEKYGWTLDETMGRALDLAEVVLEAKDEDPGSKLYLYRGGKRYAVQIED